MARWIEISRNNIWSTLINPHHIYVWRVRILLLSDQYFANFCPAEMHKDGQQCTDLIKKTANSLSGGTVTRLLVAVQKDNLEVSIYHAIKQ